MLYSSDFQFFAQNIGSDEPSSVFSCSLYFSTVFLKFFGVLSHDTFKVRRLEGIAIMAESHGFIVDHDPDHDFSELIGDVFGILNQLPYPSDFGVGIFMEVGKEMV